MPFPSHRCQTCRQRRVKCSDTRPKCTQCVKSSRKCTWDAPEEHPLTFRSENLFASGAVTRRKKRTTPERARLEAQSSLAPRPEDGCGTTALIPRPNPHTTPRCPLQQPLETQALNYYAQRYFGVYMIAVLAPENLYACVTPQLSRVSPDSLLGLSLSAISLATFGRSRGLPLAVSRSHRRYSAALAAMRVAVENSEVAQTDDCLMAARILCSYENMTCRSENSVPAEQGRKHLQGAAAMLRLRHAGQNAPFRTVFLDRVVRREYLRAVILQGLPLPKWLEDGADFGECGSDLSFDYCFVEAAKLRLEARSVLWSTQTQATRYDPGLLRNLRSLIHHAIDADDSLVAWADTMTAHQSSEGHRPEIKGQSASKSVLPEYLQKIEEIVTWNRWRASRAMVNLILIRAVSVCGMLQPHLVDLDPMTGLQAQANLQDAVSQICASVPSFFKSEEALVGRQRDGEVSTEELAVSTKDYSPRLAMLLVFPLAVSIASEAWIPPDQARWLKKQLREVSRVTGSATLEGVSARKFDEASLVSSGMI